MIDFPVISAEYLKSYIQPSIGSMTTKYELCTIETYTKDAFTATGRIIDLGCWMGATTVAMARGLSQNRVTGDFKVVEAYDMFIWKDWMDHCGHVSHNYKSGDDFLAAVRESCLPFSKFVELNKYDLTKPAIKTGPIEFMFIDAMKSWALAKSIISEYFRELIPEISYIVHQDFAWCSLGITSIHLTMWALRNYFELVYNIPHSTSVIFKCIRTIDKLPPLEMALFSLGMIHEAYEYCYTCVTPNKLPNLKMSKILLLIQQNYTKAAYDEIVKLYDIRLPENVIDTIINFLDCNINHELSPYMKRLVTN